MKKIFLSFIVIVLASGTNMAQFPNFSKPSYFNDDEERRIDIVLTTIEVDDGLIYSFTQQNRGFGVAKVGFDGRAIWATNYQSPQYYFPSTFEIQLWDDGYLYGISTGAGGAYNTTPNLATIWKINPKTGAVIWARDHESTRTESLDIAEVDSNKFAMIFYKDTTLSRKQAFISTFSKSDGAEVQTRKLSTTGWYEEMMLEADKAQNTVVALGTKMWCFKNGNLDSIKWERTYDKSVEFEELYVDQSDSLYLLLEDERDYGAIYRLDKNTGATNMVAKTNHRSVELHNVLFTDSFLYATTKYGGVGISVFKFSKADGVTIWSQGHTLAPNGSKATQNWVTSTTVDAQSDLIIAGYHYRVNDLKVCSAIKISGKHGRLLNRATISNYGGQADTKSECRFITENDNKLYMLAHLNYNADFHYARLIRMDTAFNRVAQWDLRSKSPFVSQTLDIQKHNDKMLVFKQKGAKVSLESYTLSGKLEWSKEYGSAYYAQAGRLLVEGDYAYISFTNYPEHAFLRYKRSPSIPDQPTSLQVNRIELTFGGTSGSDTFQSDDESLNTLQLLHHKNRVYVLYEGRGFQAIRYYENDKFSQLEHLGGGLYSVVRSLRERNEFNGHYNLMTVYDGYLYCVNSGGIRQVDLDLGFSKRYHDFGKNGGGVYYNIAMDGGIMYLCGKAINGGALFSSVDIAEDKGRFEKTISEFHSFSAVQVLDSSIILAGSANGKAFFSSYDKYFFRYNWLSEIDTTSNHSLAQSFRIFEDKEAIVWYGTRIHPDHTADGLIGFLKTDGTNVHTHTLTDSIMGRSSISCMELTNDSTMWFGGSHNIGNVNQGLIGVLTLDTSFRDIQKEDTLIGYAIPSRTELRIFPNPTKGLIHFECPGHVIQSVKMFNMMGQEIEETDIHLDMFQLQLNSNIPEGHYVIQIKTDVAIMRQVIEVVR